MASRRDSDFERASVIIPCYNQSHYLAEAIESVLVQTSPAAEIIVIDDGSSDETRAVAASFPQARYIRQPNRGLAAARNTGVRGSRGTYLIFLDADDRLLPGAIEAGIRAMDGRPDCVFAYGRHQLIDANGRVVASDDEAVSVGDNHYQALLRSNCIGACHSVIFRRRALQGSGPFDRRLRACEDYDLYLRLARRGRVCRHTEIVAEYRQHEDSMSRSNGLMLSTVVTVLRRQRRYVRNSEEDTAALKQGIAWGRSSYGRPLRLEFTRRCRRHEWRAAMVSGLLLARFCPRELFCDVAPTLYAAGARLSGLVARTAHALRRAMSRT